MNMKRKIQSIIIILLLISVTITFFIIPKNIMESVTFSISIWKDAIIPSLFPFFMISELLINYGFIELISELTKNIMSKYFHLPGSASFVLIGSMISGFPSSAKYIDELIKDKKISDKEAGYLLKFCHFSNPMFVVGTVGILLLNNKDIGILILIVHILTNFIIAIIYRPKNNYYQKEKISIINAINKMHKKRTNNTLSFSETLSQSIFKTIKTLLLLLGIITTFIILQTILNNLFNLNNISSSIFSGLLEMTTGIKKISNTNLSLSIKASVITFFLSFGGLSIHMQIMSILSNTTIKYLPYFISRIIHGVTSGLIIFILLSLN